MNKPEYMDGVTWPGMIKSVAVLGRQQWVPYNVFYEEKGEGKMGGSVMALPQHLRSASAAMQARVWTRQTLFAFVSLRRSCEPRTKILNRCVTAKNGKKKEGM